MTIAADPWDALVEPTTRAPRSVESRSNSERKKVWAPPTMLPDPEPQDGWVFKWVRTGSRGTDDKTNYQKRLREGWEPVNADEHPEMMVMLNIGQHAGHVEVGGLILCKMSQEMVDQRNRYYRDRTLGELEAAESNYMRDSDERMKKVLEKRRKVVFGRSPGGHNG